MRPLPSVLFADLREPISSHDLRARTRLLLEDRPLWRSRRPSRLAEAHARRALADDLAEDTYPLMFIMRVLLRELLQARTHGHPLTVDSVFFVESKLVISVRLRPRDTMRRTRAVLRGAAGVPPFVPIVPVDSLYRLRLRAQRRFIRSWRRFVSPNPPPIWDERNFLLRNVWAALPLGHGTCTIAFWATRMAVRFVALPAFSSETLQYWLASPHEDVRAFAFSQLAFLRAGSTVPWRDP